MGHCITVDPEDSTVIHVRHLKHGVYPWITGTSFTEDDLTHPPIGIQLMRNLLCCLNNHKVASLDAQKRWLLGPFNWADRWGDVVNAHQ